MKSARLENTDTDLLDIPYGDWSQTALIDWSAPESRYGQSTALNALYYGTLLDAAGVADALGNQGQASAWRQRADNLRARINEHLYRPAEGRYSTGIADGQISAPTLHAQAWALAYDIVPEQERQRVANALLALIPSDPASPNMGIYGMFWVLEGLGRAGRISEATAIIKRFYGHMLDLGATTWWEGFDAYRYYTSSLSHGWGTSPTWFLSTYVLGAERVGPNAWRVRPGTSDLSRVAGSLPLRDGVLKVRWEQLGCGASELQLNAPAGSSGSVIIPSADAALALTLDGAPIWQDGQPLIRGVIRQPYGVQLALGEGQHRLEIEQTCQTTDLSFAAR
jgi:alpha-L-rhamnosidase